MGSATARASGTSSSAACMGKASLRDVSGHFFEQPVTVVASGMLETSRCHQVDDKISTQSALFTHQLNNRWAERRS